MADKTLQAGIVGLGFIGAGDQVSGDRLGQQVRDLDGTHASALAGNPRISLVAGSSREQGRRERFAARTGALVFEDWRDMLARERLDIVSIATYAPQHAEVAIECFRHGVRVVYCEKPIAPCLADAGRMLTAARQAKGLLVIDHNRRFNPNYRRLRDLIAGGGLGKLTSVSLQWGSGRLGNIGTHVFDACRMLTGRSVQAVTALLDLSGRPDCRGTEFHDPGGSALFRMEHGLVATVDATDFGRVPLQIAIQGTLGRAITGRASVALEYWDGRHDQWAAPDPAVSSMDRAVAEMVEWLDEGKPFPYDAAEAVQALEVIVACHASQARHHAWIDLPLTGPDRDLEVQTA
jgi:predicted dehydrogenase